MRTIKELFDDQALVEKIKVKLPKLFQIAELESSRDGKIGMEVGTMREKILTALLIYTFGEENVNSKIPTTEAEVDVKLFDAPISIKTFTGKLPHGVKLVWTVDAEKAREFRDNYTPSCDMLIVQINWDNGGGLFYISKDIQFETLQKLGRNAFFILPKQGTNPRGVEMSGEAMKQLLDNLQTLKIPINWEKEIIQFNQFERWVELWQED